MCEKRKWAFRLNYAYSRKGTRMFPNKNFMWFK